MIKKDKDNKTQQGGCDCEVINAQVVEKVRAQMPSGRDFIELSTLYKMFSDPTRIKILWALYNSGQQGSEMCVCDLAVLLNITKSAISHQLKSLRLTNLVKFEKRGKVALYSLDDEHIKDIFEKGFAHIQHIQNKTGT